MADVYAKVGKKQRAIQIYNDLWKTSSQYVRYYLSLSGNGLYMSLPSCGMHLQIMMQYLRAVNEFDANWAKQHEKELVMMVAAYQSKGGKMQ